MVDQYGNKTDTLNAENMKAVSVSAEDLDVSALCVDWQVSRNGLKATHPATIQMALI